MCINRGVSDSAFLCETVGERTGEILVEGFWSWWMKREFPFFSLGEKKISKGGGHEVVPQREDRFFFFWRGGFSPSQ